MQARRCEKIALEAIDHRHPGEGQAVPRRSLEACRQAFLGLLCIVQVSRSSNAQVRITHLSTSALC